MSSKAESKMGILLCGITVAGFLPTNQPMVAVLNGGIMQSFAQRATSSYHEKRKRN
jgi:hypothetical protein